MDQIQWDHNSVAAFTNTNEMIRDGFNQRNIKKNAHDFVKPQTIRIHKLFYVSP